MVHISPILLTLEMISQKGQQLHCINGHANRVCSLLSAAGKVWSSSTTEVCVWHQNKPDRIKRFPLEPEHGWILARIHTNEVNQVWVFSQDPTGETGKMIVWDAKVGMRLLVIVIP